VVLQVISPGEGLVTERTLVRLLPGVEPYMAVTVRAGGEALLAVLAEVELVRSYAVGLQGTEGVVARLARLAFEEGVSGWWRGQEVAWSGGELL